MNDGSCLHEMVYDPGGAPVDYRILDINPMYEEITGLKRDDVIGRLASEVYEAGSAPYLDVYAEVAANGIPAVFDLFPADG